MGDAACCRIVGVVVSDQCGFIAEVITVGKNVMINFPILPIHIVESKILRIGKEIPLLYQGEYRSVVLCDQLLIGGFIPVGSSVFHTVLFMEPLYLPVTKHRQAGHGDHECAYSEVLVPVAELSDGGVLVGVVHEVYKSFKDFRFKVYSTLDGILVFFIFFTLQHIHKGAVVHPMHSKGSDKKALHHPECFSQKQSVGGFFGDPVDNFTPEFLGHITVELFRAHSVEGTAGNVASATGGGIPQAMNMFSGKGHRRVKTDYRKISGYMQNGLD